MAQSLSPAREIAYDAYVQVMEQGADPDTAVEKLAERHPKSLKRLDHNFVKEIVYGSLRWHSKMYWILQNTSKRDLDQTTPEIRAALVCGTYQIFYMDRVPDRAAVNESAEYIRKKQQANAVSFVNGILRQIARRAEYFAKPDKTNQPVEYLSLQFAHPQWMVSRWIQHFKFERMETMLSSNNKPPPWTVRVNTEKTPQNEIHKLQQMLLKRERTHSDRRPLRSALRLRQCPRFDEESMFTEGYFTIQDEASQLIAPLVDPAAGEVVYDLCAGPGGKISHLAALSQGEAHITGVEKNPSQMEKAQETLTRLGHKDVTWVEQDVVEWQPEQKADKILLDAPCSGLGVIRRHPEGKWQKKISLIREMADLQRKLLAHALELLKSGGHLVFSVCSFEPEETTEQLNWLKEKYGDTIELISPVSKLPDYYKRYVTRQNVLLIYAGNQDDLDGFGAFIVKKL